jgi:uroporphyrinogen decarboxylase
MTRKERFANALARKPVDRVPAHEWAWDDTVARWTKQGHLKPGEDPIRHFDMELRSHGWLNNIADLDFKDVVLEETEETILKLDGNQAKLRWPKGRDGTPEHVSFGVTDRAGWEEKIKPFLVKVDRRRIPIDGYRAERLKAAANQEYFTCDNLAPFELMFRVIGHEKLLTSMVDDPDWVRDMALTFADMVIHHWEVLFAEAGWPDGIFYYEDMGFKQRPFMSPAMYREFLKPAHKKLFDFAHSRNMPVLLHSCGFVRPLLPDLIDAGMSCLHAIESKAGMDLVDLFKDFGQKIAFFGGLDARALVANDREWIEREMQRKIPPIINGGGGYILRSDHSIPPQVDYETLKFFFQRGREIGTPKR